MLVFQIPKFLPLVCKTRCGYFFSSPLFLPFSLDTTVFFGLRFFFLLIDLDERGIFFPERYTYSFLPLFTRGLGLQCLPSCDLQSFVPGSPRLLVTIRVMAAFFKWFCPMPCPPGCRIFSAALFSVHDTLPSTTLQLRMVACAGSFSGPLRATRSVLQLHPWCLLSSYSTGGLFWCDSSLVFLRVSTGVKIFMGSWFGPVTPGFSLPICCVVSSGTFACVFSVGPLWCQSPLMQLFFFYLLSLHYLVQRFSAFLSFPLPLTSSSLFGWG